MIDENLPRTLVSFLRDAGLEAVDARDTGLRGKPDCEVFDYAVSNCYAIVTKDRGFGNTLLYPIASHHGIVLVRYPDDLAAPLVNRAIASALGSMAAESFEKTLVILTTGRIRIRRIR